MLRNCILNCADTQSEIFYKFVENNKSKSADIPLKAGISSQECFREVTFCQNNRKKLRTYKNETRAIVKHVRPSILAKLAALQRFKSDDA